MTLTAPLLMVGLPDPEMDALRRRTPGHDLISVPDGPRAVACLRTWGHGIPAALLDADALKDELEELVVYLKGTFPEASIALLGPVTPKDRKRLKLLGVAHFLKRPLTRRGLAPLLRRASGLIGHDNGLADWAVRVDRGAWVEITVPSREDYVSRVQELIDLLERSQWDRDTRDELMLALDELVHNAMEWGNRYDEGRRVRVSYFCAEDRIVLKVEDEGEGFSVSSLDDPTDDLKAHAVERAEAGKRRGGLGIHLIRNLMDEVLYNDRGNVVMLTKRLDRPL